MRVAYCVLSHTLPGQVLRLARLLRAGSPDAHVLIHHDPTGPRLERPALDRLGGVRLLAPTSVQWGRGSHLDAFLRLVEVAVTDTDADWVVLLSGQDLPARPVAAIEADLAAADVDGFVDGHLVQAPDGAPDEFQRRSFYTWRAVPDPGRLGRRAAAALAPRVLLREVPDGLLLGTRATEAPFGPDLPCRRGQDWLTLSRRAAEALHRAARDRPELVAFYRSTLLATESFPHTVLHAEPGLRLSGVSRRHVVFDPGAAHPRVLRMGDADAVLASGADFARKFDERVDAEVLDRLEAAVAPA